MTGQNIPKLVTATGQLMWRPGKLVSVSVIAPTSGAKLDFYNSADNSGTKFYTVDGSVSTPVTELWIPFKLLYVVVTGAASYNVVVN